MAQFVDSDDWRAKCKSINETIAEARKKAMFVDVRFLVGQPPRYTACFSAHKMILACGSPVFEAMLFGQLAEKKDTITVPDDDPEAFEMMLQHIYGQRIAFSSIIAACKSYSIGDKYLIAELCSKSADFIKASAMKEDDFWGIIEGKLLSNVHIEAKFRHCIELYADKLIKSKEFLHVPAYVTKMFLQTDAMNVSEYELLTSVTKWCMENLGPIKSKTQDFLQYIRFSVLTPYEFCLFTEKFPYILDASTSLTILKHLNYPSSYNLPVWCTTNKAVRKPIKPEPVSSKSNIPSRSGRSGRVGRSNP